VLLLSAVGARLLGDGEAADASLADARRTRDALVRGREEDWERSVLAATFDRFEALAARR
jgi:hypothetical protein